MRHSLLKKANRFVAAAIIFALLMLSSCSLITKAPEEDLPVIINSYEDLLAALKKGEPSVTLAENALITITSNTEIAKDIEIIGDDTTHIQVAESVTLSVAEGATLHIRMPKLEVLGKIANAGTIDVAAEGKILFHDNESEIGTILSDTKLGSIEIAPLKLTTEAFELYLSPETPYSSIVLTEAFEYTSDIMIEKDMTLSGGSIYISDIQTLSVSENATLTVKIPSLTVRGLIENRGTIVVAPSGRITFHRESPEIGNISAVGATPSSAYSPNVFDHGQIVICPAFTTDSETFAKYLAPNSVYTAVGLYFGRSDNSLVQIDVTEDLVVPAGKSLVLNIDCVLRVPSGVTLTVDGYIETYHDPIVDGTLIGEKNVIVQA